MARGRLRQSIMLVACFAVSAAGATARSCVASPEAALWRLRGGADAPVQLITAQGELLAANAAAIATGMSGGVGVVASVGGSGRARRILNAVFGTGFPTELRLSSQDDDAGAWLASSPSASAIVVETRATEASGEQRSAADASKLGSFSLTLADAVIVHSPCVVPTATDLEESFERLFSHHLAAKASAGADGGARTVLVHVGEPDSELSDEAVRKACKAAWASASALTEMKGTAFGDVFDLTTVTMPLTKAEDPAAFDAGVAALRSRLSGLGAGGKLATPSAFADAATAAWREAGALLDSAPTEAWLRERFLAARSYESAYEQGQSSLRKWGPAVSKGKLVGGFGPAAASMIDAAMATFDGGVSSCSAAAAPMLAQRRSRLSKALQNDVQELFVKQHRQLSVSTIEKYKASLLSVVSRSGTVAEWQQESLRRSAEKAFDSKIGDLIVPGLGDNTRAQLTTSFAKLLTETTQKFTESPPMQLQAIAAMRRKTGKAPKPPRGVRAGLGLTGAIRSKMGGGNGNMQTYAGYSAGLNSAHVMFANDGNIADSSGAEPPFWRWQPKMNFDISI